MTTSDIRHGQTKIVGSLKISVRVRLNDECRNGHEDFSITGQTWEKNKRGLWEESSFGCIHDTIAEHFPELAEIFVPLHLSDWEGCPMHAAANGRYWIKEGNREHAKSTLRVNDAELDVLSACGAETDEEFSFFMEKMGLRERYRAEAARGIAYLEEKTGEKFASQATRSQWPKLSDEKAKEIARKEKAGYFTPARAEDRKNARVAAKKAKMLDDRQREERDNARKSELAYAFDVALIELFSKSSYEANVIFYSHTSTIKANWNKGAKGLTRGVFALLEETLKANPIFERVRFEW